MAGDLIDGRWIRFDTGLTVSLREAFANAATVGNVDSGDPLADAATLRLLVAILSVAVPDVDPAQIARDGVVPERVGEYLSAQRDQFQIFGAERPFLQHPDLNAHDFDVDPPTRLSPWRQPSTSTMLVYGNACESPYDRDVPPIPWDAAARRLIGLHAWSHGHGGGGTQGAMRATGLFAIPEGRTLAQTLALNLAAPSGLSASAGWWEAPAPAIADFETREARSHAEWLAHPARWIRLIPAANGELVRGIVYKTTRGARLALPERAIEPYVLQAARGSSKTAWVAPVKLGRPTAAHGEGVDTYSRAPGHSPWAHLAALHGAVFTDKEGVEHAGWGAHQHISMLADLVGQARITLVGIGAGDTGSLDHVARTRLRAPLSVLTAPDAVERARELTDRAVKYAGQVSWHGGGKQQVGAYWQHLDSALPDVLAAAHQGRHDDVLALIDKYGASARTAALGGVPPTQRAEARAKP